MAETKSQVCTISLPTLSTEVHKYMSSSVSVCGGVGQCCAAATMALAFMGVISSREIGAFLLSRFGVHRGAVNANDM